MRSYMYIFSAYLLIVSVATCVTPTTTAGPEIAPDVVGEGEGLGDNDNLPEYTKAVTFLPTSEFAKWWYEMEQCTGRRGDFRAVSFYVVPSNEIGAFGCKGTFCFYGRYVSREHAIYLSDEYFGDRWLVTHEMLHALGVYGHPSPPFGDCAPLHKPGSGDE